ncbi:MAG: hypothetical protein AAFP93_03230 [Bacteroidota bacterium]
MPTIQELLAPKRLLAQVVVPHRGHTWRKQMWYHSIPYYGSWYKWTNIKERFKNSPIGPKEVPVYLGIIVALPEVAYTLGAYRSISNYFEYSSVLRNLALRMADAQAFVLAARSVSGVMASSSELEKLYGSRLTKLRELLAQSKKNTELGDLIRYLKTQPYTSWSYFFNDAGKLLASHKLFTEYKDEFADAMHELGELDAFLSIATLVQEARDSKAKHQYTFVEYIGRGKKSKPYINLVDMWNPFLDAKTAVGNSVEMDAAGGVRNIILTGPNAGGKSTFLKGVTSSLLLGQTLGIAPAKKLIMTPFNKINTYINVQDDVAAGKSLFMAEVDRAQKHLNTLSNLKAQEFSFTIMDEVFSGTNPREGAAAVYSVLEAMADYSNAINIVATHYPVVMLLEKNVAKKGFKNYKVYIKYNRDTDKKIHYTYKVIPGKSNQAIAIQILKEQGQFNARLLKRAEEIINHPERYRAEF